MSEEYTISVESSSIKKGGYAVINEHPTKAVDISASKTGKHGSMKMHIVGVDIFTGRKYETVMPGHKTIQVPIVKKCDYVLSCISEDGYLSLVNEAGDLREDIQLPSGELGNDLKNAYERDQNLIVQTTCAMGEEHVSSYKVSKD